MERRQSLGIELNPDGLCIQKNLSARVEHALMKRLDASKLREKFRALSSGQRATLAQGRQLCRSFLRLLLRLPQHFDEPIDFGIFRHVLAGEMVQDSACQRRFPLDGFPEKARRCHNRGHWCDLTCASINRAPRVPLPLLTALVAMPPPVGPHADQRKDDRSTTEPSSIGSVAARLPAASRSDAPYVASAAIRPLFGRERGQHLDHDDHVFLQELADAVPRLRLVNLHAPLPQSELPWGKP